MSVVNLLRTSLRNTTYPIYFNSYSKVSAINITTVCSPSSDGFQCKCEDHYSWPFNQCLLHGSCNSITNDTCGCINAIPSGGQYCQSVDQHMPSFDHEYLFSIELHTTDLSLITQLRRVLNNSFYPIYINSYTKISGVNITTVCSPSSDGFQCICEDQYRWSCDQCFLHGSCDNITNDTCGCINALPSVLQYCQPINRHNFTVCSVTTSPTTTTSPFNHEYLISIELNTTDTSVITILRNLLKNTTYPLDFNRRAKILDINLTTVCSASSDAFQCICEAQYRWSCDQCFLHGSCDNITNDTCGCINAIPSGGQYCQSVDQHNFTACPVTTTSPTTTSGPAIHEYLISVELSTTDMSMINLLRNILRNTSYPIYINSYSKIFEINITTVCSPSSDGFQCTCEGLYRWSCDQCFLHGSCDNITNNTCGCINAILPGGQYCQSAEKLNDTFCPSTTTTTFPTTYTTLSTTSVTNTTTALSTTPPTLANTTTAETLPTTRLTINTPVSKETTTSTTKTSTTNTTSTTVSGPVTTTPEKTVFQLEMSISFDKEYTAQLSDPTSSDYMTFESQIIGVLHDQYEDLGGFVHVFVKSFSPGSVIAEYVVETSEVDSEKLIQVNQGLPEALQDIAPVLGPVTARYNSPNEIRFPAVTYTGRLMTLTCGPASDGINLGRIAEAKWKFNGREIKTGGRIQIVLTSTMSNLIINNVIQADAGIYECNMRFSALTFVQMGTAKEIKVAPNVRVPGKVNVQCADGETHPLQCCVQSNYDIQWFLGTSTLNSDTSSDGESNCILHGYSLSGCGDSPRELSFTCRVLNEAEVFEETTRMIIFTDNAICRNSLYGNGRPGDIATIACDPGQEGNRMAKCRDTGEWSLFEDNCIVTEIKELLIDSEDLVVEEVPQFAAELNDLVQKEKEEITNSSATISAIVDILNTIAKVSNELNETVMTNMLETVDVLIGDDARESWEFLRQTGRNDSSRLLNSMETLADELVGQFTIRTGSILLNTTMFNDSFMANFNSSVVIDISNTNSTNLTITTIVFSTLDNVLPPRDSSYNATVTDTNGTSASFNETINAAVALVTVKTEIQNISLSFIKQNYSLTQNPQCVFWNFTLFDNLGAWDDEGCTLVSDINNTVTCNCDHLTSFSILMATDIPESIRVALDVITYVGVCISLASLIICLIIEGYVWKALTRNSTAFMRHMCIVNTALSLLIADICFIIAAAYAKNPLENPGEDHKVPLGPCTAATFFMHFFYLALFFWMLVSGLLLFYRTTLVFSHMSRSTMMAFGFVLGYVCPLIIAVVTVAATAPGNGYIKENDACWLNWYKTKALLALVIPALAVVFVNILITIVVLYKMLRRGVGDATTCDEKHTLVVVFRCVIILTPLFGLTWSLGVGTMISSTNEGIHIAFAFFNSLQGFFILVFGTLLDSKIRAILSKKQLVSSSGSGSNQTASTSGGISSLSGLKWLGKLRGKRYVYRVSEALNSSSTGGSESFSNI
ncbi:adhesion G protein-coupled receptor F5-like isoform X2 [Syngnathoides biaculeatus]|nr:adhesion G protein-coupled receptor F5-like isoform X2 [Syngnathoides biaculeatus]XP_061667564.1 adhesion G protein-coupled receptor F5-like isoform X2 [Syngnathoides biaculeatus]